MRPTCPTPVHGGVRLLAVSSPKEVSGERWMLVLGGGWAGDCKRNEIERKRESATVVGWLGILEANPGGPFPPELMFFPIKAKRIGGER